MSDSGIRFQVNGGVAVITLDRPEQLNTFDGAMAGAWSAAYRECDADDAVRAVVVTGTGKAFCAGADLSAGADTFTRPDTANFSACPVWPAWRVRKPVVAACQGHAIGVGLSLALQCDVRFVAEDAKYGLLQVRRGVLADGCSHWLLPRLVGQETALDLMLSGRRFSGREAAALGLAWQSLPADEVLPAALAYARELAEHSAPLVMGLAKRLIWTAWDRDIDAFERHETRWLAHTMDRADAREGGLAYAEKRPPAWTGSVSREWPEEETTPEGDHAAVTAVLNRYARACDRRDWAAFDTVFHPAVNADYGGEYCLQGRKAVVAMIRSLLGDCGPTQHLLGNTAIRVDGDRATSECYVRAAHAGRGEHSDATYEVWAEYRDALVRTPDGWRIIERTMAVHWEIGDRRVLGTR